MKQFSMNIYVNIKEEVYTYKLENPWNIKNATVAKIQDELCRFYYNYYYVICILILYTIYL